ncbi:protein disulfide oxidoreductase [Hyperthermus butylicus]|uniref:protein disulfide oxidoreductase n=1 Tax=Hyperthermus butylicus TaxID=54248 RepID=UPI000B2F90C4|nr:thioredoxin family protein [Hyperthermus butylicus]
MFDPVKMEIDKETRDAIKEAFEDLVKPVEINVFIGPNCRYCDETVKIAKVLEEEAPVKNGKKLVTMKIYEKDKHVDVFKKHGVERIPSLTLVEGRIKYTGTPSGEELRGLVETIIRISQEDSGLDETTVEKIKLIEKPVHVEIIVTPQCPYCPYAALLSNMFAYEAWRNGKTDFVSEIVEAYENPDIADKYGVTSVPAIAINGVLAFVGVPYEEDFIERIIDVVERRRTIKTEFLEGATGI